MFKCPRVEETPNDFFFNGKHITNAHAFINEKRKKHGMEPVVFKTRIQHVAVDSSQHTSTLPSTPPTQLVSENITITATGAPTKRRGGSAVKQLSAFLDTGAQRSCIGHSVLQYLGLTQLEQPDCNVVTANGATVRPLGVTPPLRVCRADGAESSLVRFIVLDDHAAHCPILLGGDWIVAVGAVVDMARDTVNYVPPGRDYTLHVTPDKGAAAVFKLTEAAETLVAGTAETLIHSTLAAREAAALVDDGTRDPTEGADGVTTPLSSEGAPFTDSDIPLSQLSDEEFASKVLELGVIDKTLPQCDRDALIRLIVKHHQ